MKEHKKDNSYSITKKEFKLVGYEFCTNNTDAIDREKYSEIEWAKGYLKNMINNYVKYWTFMNEKDILTFKSLAEYLRMDEDAIYIPSDLS